MSPRVDLAPQEWFTLAELAALGLPGLATTKRGLQLIADREGWATMRTASGEALAQPRKARGGGIEYHLSLLPETARAKLAQVRPGVTKAEDRASTLLRYERLPQSAKDEAFRRLTFIQRVERLQRDGLTKTKAIEHAVNEASLAARANGGEPGVSERTANEWFQRIVGVEPQDRVAYLAPRYAGRMSTKSCPVEAWDLYKANYLRLEKPTHARCYRDLLKLAESKGWALPSAKYFERRIAAEIPEPVLVQMREGDKAVRHTFAHVTRSRDGLHPHAMANLDGHLWDVWVEWEDGTQGRPYCLAVQDIASSMPLGLRFDRTLNHHLVRLALGDTFREFGLVERLLMDNGSENQAKEIQGGIPRMRNKAVEEEPAGLLKILGIDAVSATPYWGQAKPVERMFRNWAHDVAKAPAFAGAYCGHNALSKPENHRSKAIPIAQFEAIVRQELEHYRDQLGRTGIGMNGRSFRQVYQEGVAANPPRQLTDEQLRLCMLASEPRPMDRQSGAVTLLGNTFWSPELANLKRQRVIARFDPADLSKPAYLYSLDGRFLLEVPRHLDGGFDSLVQAQRVGKARRDHVKAVKKAGEALRRVGIEHLAAELDAVAPTIPASPPPVKAAGNVVVPAFGVPRTPQASSNSFTDDWEASVANLFGRK